uniref:Uncharacterized protein n=1 Tax=Ixodes scapularis TaxID=6945 RepID=A0A4D5RXK1_IXOSC
MQVPTAQWVWAWALPWRLPSGARGNLQPSVSSAFRGTAPSASRPWRWRPLPVCRPTRFSRPAATTASYPCLEARASTWRQWQSCGRHLPKLWPPWTSRPSSTFASAAWRSASHRTLTGSPSPRCNYDSQKGSIFVDRYYGSHLIKKMWWYLFFYYLHCCRDC